MLSIIRKNVAWFVNHPIVVQVAAAAMALAVLIQPNVPGGGGGGL